MSYGLPYQGSKNKIAKQIVDFLPAADYFVDLFAGGCAVTHAALMSGKYRHVIANDITGSALLFKQAAAGQFVDNKEWISREEWLPRREELLMKLLWGFGYTATAYCYNQAAEPWNKALHFARCFGDFSYLEEMDINLKTASRQEILTRHEELWTKYSRWFIGEFLHSDKKHQRTNGRNRQRINLDREAARTCDFLAKLDLTRAEHQNRINRILACRCLFADSLTALQCDYKSVDIPAGAVVYCDPPYQNTDQRGYSTQTFDSNAFFTWCQGKKYYISEYSAPFPMVASFVKEGGFRSENNHRKRQENIYLS